MFSKLTNMTTIEKVRAEIERKLEIAKFQEEKTAEENNYEAHLQWNQEVAVCNELLRFIDTLPEQPSGEEKFCNLLDAMGDCGFSQDNILLLKSIWKGAYVTDKKGVPEQLEADLEKELDLFYKNEDYGPSEAIEYHVHKSIAAYFYNLGRNQRKEEAAPKIHGWVARDKNETSLHVFFSEPHRERGFWDNSGTGKSLMYIDEHLFPDLKWEDKPIEVELEIHRV